MCVIEEAQAGRLYSSGRVSSPPLSFGQLHWNASAHLERQWDQNFAPVPPVSRVNCSLVKLPSSPASSTGCADHYRGCGLYALRWRDCKTYEGIMEHLNADIICLQGELVGFRS